MYEEEIDKFLATFNRAKGKAQYFVLQPLPQMETIRSLVHEMMELMFPGRSGDCEAKCTLEQKVHLQMHLVLSILREQIILAYNYDKPNENPSIHQAKAEEDVKGVLDQLPEIRRMLKSDAEAGFRGDPATNSVREVIISYPCMKAITTYRIAHVLYARHVPLVPRMMTETAHEETGIDINPGATIGSSFFIDHGTGVVIGETAVLGNNVKLYQGVTLGALSFPKDACGMLIRGTKRHPTVEDNVTIYSHATILGDITIGRNAVIGAGVWIKQDVPEDTLVMMEEPKTISRDLSKRKYEKKNT